MQIAFILLVVSKSAATYIDLRLPCKSWLMSQGSK